VRIRIAAHSLRRHYLGAATAFSNEGLGPGFLLPGTGLNSRIPIVPHIVPHTLLGYPVGCKNGSGDPSN
jgi:hypothetical protein